MNKVVVYTCITGNYDALKAPLAINNEIDYICFCDHEIDVPFPWRLVLVSDVHLFSGYDNKTINRALKICPHQCDLLSAYQLSIYIDGSIQILSNLSSLLSEVDHSDADIFMYDHFQRDCLYEEASVCMKVGHGWYWEIHKQVSRYKMEGFPENYGLFECGIIFRKKNKSVNLLMEHWFKEYLRGVKRDQLALTFVAWKNNIKIKSLGKSDARFNHKDFKLFIHNKLGSDLDRRIKAKINRTISFFISGRK